MPESSPRELSIVYQCDCGQEFTYFPRYQQCAECHEQTCEFCRDNERTMLCDMCGQETCRTHMKGDLCPSCDVVWAEEQKLDQEEAA